MEPEARTIFNDPERNYEDYGKIISEMKQLFTGVAPFGFTIDLIGLKVEAGDRIIEIKNDKPAELAIITAPELRDFAIGVKIECHRNDMPDLTLTGFWPRDYLANITTPFFIDAICNHGDAQVRAYLGRSKLRVPWDWIVALFKK